MTADESETERGSERQFSPSHCYTDPPRRPAHTVMWAAFNNAWTSTAAAKGSQNPRQNQIAFIHELIQAQAAAGEAQRARREAGRRCVRKKDGGSRWRAEQARAPPAPTHSFILWNQRALSWRADPRGSTVYNTVTTGGSLFPGCVWALEDITVSLSVEEEEVYSELPSEALQWHTGTVPVNVPHAGRRHGYAFAIASICRRFYFQFLIACCFFDIIFFSLWSDCSEFSTVRSCSHELCCHFCTNPHGSWSTPFICKGRCGASRFCYLFRH